MVTSLLHGMMILNDKTQEEGNHQLKNVLEASKQKRSVFYKSCTGLMHK